MSDSALARLSKDGERVVCAKIDCGYEFAWILRRSDFGMEGLDFMPGWNRGADGVWKMSKRAFQNHRDGFGRRTRRPPKSETFNLFAAGKYIRPNAKGGTYRPDSHGNNVFTNSFPMAILCPQCGLKQTAAQDRLALS